MITHNAFLFCIKIKPFFWRETGYIRFDLQGKRELVFSICNQLFHYESKNEEGICWTKKGFLSLKCFGAQGLGFMKFAHPAIHFNAKSKRQDNLVLSLNLIPN